MPIYLLDETLRFPDPELADPEGIIALGGDLSPERLMRAYQLGIFPWFNPGDPIIWHAPPLRMVLEPESLSVGRSLRKVMRKTPYTLTFDRAFDAVLDHCAQVPRPGQSGTWITDEMRLAYQILHRRGLAHSVEAWVEDELVGGLYGVTVGGVFCGESMFALRPDASKIAFATLVPLLRTAGYILIDCQVYTPHLARFGAVEWPRAHFTRILQRGVRLTPTPVWPEKPLSPKGQTP